MSEIVREVLRFEGRFVTVPNRWARDERLSWTARGLLVLLMSHKPGWRVDMAALSNGHHGKTAISKAVNELIELGYLERAQPRQASNRFASVEYSIKDPFEGENTWSEPEGGFPEGGFPEGGFPEGGFPEGGNQPLKNTNKKKTIDKKTISHTRESAEQDPIEETFAHAWELWPRKDGKQGALKAWRRATQKLDPSKLLEALAPVAEIYRQQAAAEGSIRYIPWLQTWLNQERWADPRPLPPAHTSTQQDWDAAKQQLLENPNWLQSLAGGGGDG